MRSTASTPIIYCGTILCVEDEAELRADLVEELEEAGYQVIEAESGEQAAEQLKAARPDLILCDINMPSGNGYTLLEALRKNFPHLADVPFVFLTALANPRDIVEGKQRGADDYLVKPVDFNLLLATIEARLRQVWAIRNRATQELEQLRQALTAIGRDESPATHDTVYRTLDYISLGVVLLDATLTVTFVNRVARALAAENDGLAIADTLIIADRQAAKQLHKGLEQLLAAHAPDADQLTSICIPRPSGKRDLFALAVALDRHRTEGSPLVAVFLADPELRPPVPDDVLASLFGLTPAESQVATLLAQGKRADHIAELLRVSPTTVAFHIRNLLGKTGTHRQTDLIALLLAGPMALSLDPKLTV